MTDKNIDTGIGFQFGNLGRFCFFVEFHPFAWAIGYHSHEDSSAITILCFTFGFTY
jgi:hypothetical protein